MDDDLASTYDEFTIEYVHFEGAGGVGSSSSPSVATPGPRASTDFGACYTGSTTPSSHDSGCEELLIYTTTAGNATHSSTDSHPSGHVYSNTCSY